jgi:hypothetical protein
MIGRLTGSIPIPAAISEIYKPSRPFRFPEVPFTSRAHSLIAKSPSRFYIKKLCSILIGISGN